MKGIVTDIQRGSVHDGPGLRSVVFVKGCNLNCFWCHNPEAITFRRELQFDPAKCLGCGRCLAVCPHGAHGVAPDGAHTLDRTKCVQCFLCAGQCPGGALTAAGQELTAEEVVRQVLEDLPFYRNSGGGVTISGGEPACQLDFVLEILRRCREAGVHTAVETNLNYSPERLEKLLPLVDLVMADIKAFDPELHRKGTGKSNAETFANIRHLGELKKPLILRTPVIPDFNDKPEEIANLARFAASVPGVLYYELLRYHPLGRDKALKIGREVQAVDRGTLDAGRWDAVREAAFQAAGSLPVFVNGRRYSGKKQPSGFLRQTE